MLKRKLWWGASEVVLPENVTRVDYLLLNGDPVSVGSNYVPVIDAENRAGLYNKTTESIEYATGGIDYVAYFKHGNNDYMVVKAITTSGQQDNSSATKAAAYIDTTIIPKTSKKTKTSTRMYFSSVVTNTTEALNGTTGSGRYAWGFANVNPTTRFYIGLGGQNMVTSVTRDSDWHIWKIDSENNTWAIDSTTGTFASAGTLNATLSIYLFGRNNSTNKTANKPVNGGCSWHKAWEDGEMVQNLIAVYDGSEAFMWDTVTKTKFENIGNGTKVFGYTT